MNLKNILAMSKLKRLQAIHSHLEKFAEVENEERQKRMKYLLKTLFKKTTEDHLETLFKKKLT